MPGNLVHNLVKFGRMLRRAGIIINTGRMVDLARAIEAIDIGKKEDFYYACRSLIVHRHEDFPLFDRVFSQFWHKQANGLKIDPSNDSIALPKIVPPPLKDLNLSPHSIDKDQEAERERPPILELYSSRDALRQKDFADLTDEEIDEVKRLIAELVWKLGEKRTRRQLPGNGSQFDLRRTFRNNLRYGGEILEWERRIPRYKPRPLVVLADISGSMERYTRLFLHFIYSLSWGLSQRVEVFVFSTRLTRITRQLRTRDIDRALGDISAHVPDWAGGTRIGEALKKFNYQWARRVLASRAVVLFISDGWDRGDPAEMGREMARLQRSCHRLIWLNPLLGSPDYEPRTRGTRAAIGYVDDFFPVHNLSSLEDLAGKLAHLSPKRRPRSQQLSALSPRPSAL